MEYKNKNTANRRRYKTRYKNPHNYKTKRTKAENRSAILVSVATFVIIAALVLMFTFGDSIYNFLEGAFSPSVKDPEKLSVATLPVDEMTEAKTEAPTAAESATKKPTEAPVGDPEFARLLKLAGLEESTLTGSQMIFAEASGTAARVYTFEKGSDGWEQKFSPIDGFVGTGGVAETVGPYDDTTPLGTYAIEYAFGTNYDPGTPLTYYMVHYGMRWVVDPASVNYNRLLDGDATTVDDQDCQWLHEYTRSYPYAVVFSYNREPVDSSLGCARFLHVAYDATYGGVGIAEDSLREILLWLDPAQSPAISIVRGA